MHILGDSSKNEGISVGLMEAIRQTIISAIAGPNTAVVLIAAGILGIYAEFCAPGRIVPGVLGGIFVLLGLSSIAILPINWGSVALLALAVVLLVLESKTRVHGIAGIAGAMAMTWGTLTLVDSPVPELRILWITALGVSVPLAATTVFLLRIAVRARRNKAATAECEKDGRKDANYLQ